MITNEYYYSGLLVLRTASKARVPHPADSQGKVELGRDPHARTMTPSRVVDDCVFLQAIDRGARGWGPSWLA